jgi:hypothetical protein
MTAPGWKITLPIVKSETRNGRNYLVGIASGTGIDSDTERMAPEAVESFTRQINDAALVGEPLTFRNAHAEDGVFRDLGFLTKAWITPDFEMGVEVELDDFEDNSAAKRVWRSIAKGGQWGMSVSGRIVKFVDEWVADLGRSIRTYYEVLLSEISVTSRPSYTPSLGTVLAKAIKDAAQAESDAMKGDHPSMDGEELRSEQETVEPAAETEKSDEGTVESPATEPVVEEVTDKTGEAEAEPEEGDTVKAKPSKKQRLVTALSAFLSAVEALDEPDAVETEPASTDATESVQLSASEGDGESTIDKSEAAIKRLVTDVEELRSANKSLTDRVEELRRQPAVEAPDLVYDDNVVHDFRKSDPSVRLRDLLRVEHGA